MDGFLEDRSEFEFKFKLVPVCFLLELASLSSSTWLRLLSVGFAYFACALAELYTRPLCSSMLAKSRGLVSLFAVSSA